MAHDNGDGERGGPGMGFWDMGILAKTCSDMGYFVNI